MENAIRQPAVAAQTAVTAQPAAPKAHSSGHVEGDHIYKRHGNGQRGEIEPNDISISPHTCESNTNDTETDRGEK